MLLILNRFVNARDFTLGELVVGPVIVYVLEEPWKYNARNESCIPLGRYSIELVKRANGRMGVAVLDVPKRDGILFHEGNSLEDTRGCLLPGLDWRFTGTPRVVDSAAAMRFIVSTLAEAGGNHGLTIMCRNPFYSTVTKP